MLFNVANLLKTPSGKKQLDRMDEEFDLGFSTSIGVVSGTVLMVRTDIGVWVSAKLDAFIKLECVNCLKEYDQTLFLNIEEEYVPYLDLISKKVVNIDDHESLFRIENDNLIDLSRAVLEYSHLSCPMNPKCSDGCMGICLDCGSNRNNSECDCEVMRKDSRWSPLYDLAKALN
jgi:uncharacterized protein